VKGTPDVSICIATFRRPRGLARLLGSLSEQKLPEGLDVEIVVVDNDAAGEARSRAMALCGAARTARWFVEPRQNIALARNRAVREARGHWIAFIDDDEVPDGGWLAELLRVQRLYDADAVTGPCLPRFESPPPTWIEKGGFFERPRWPTGRHLDRAYTNNVLVRSRSLALMEALFDERMGLTGGEDTEFFQRFAKAGHAIVWCDTAIVYDAVPETRANLRWILARSYRMGACLAYIQRKTDPGSVTVLRVLVHGARCVAAGILRLAASVVGGRAAAAGALHLASFGAGRMGGLFGLQYAEYRRTHGD
jgi:glycosyltransferase involved in cell wall biosynthesis